MPPPNQHLTSDPSSYAHNKREVPAAAECSGSQLSVALNTAAPVVSIVSPSPPELVLGLERLNLCPYVCGVHVYVCVCVTYEGEVWCVLAQQPGEDSLPLDALLVLEHIAVHETVQHGGVGVDVNVELQTDPLKGEMMETQGQGIKKTQQISSEGGIFFFVTSHIS